MSAKQLPDGRWVVYYRDLTGKPSKEYFGRGPDASRQAVLFDLERKMERKRAQGRSRTRRLSFEELANLYRAAKGDPSWIERALHPFVDAFGSKPCHLLTMRDLSEALARKRSGPATTNRGAAYCRAVLSWGQRSGYADSNPFRDYRRLREPEKRPQVLTPWEVSLILQVSEEYLRRAILLTVYAGLRPGPSELLGLTWDSLAWDTGVLTVAQGKVGRTKTVVLPDELLADMERWKAEGGEHIIQFRGKPITHFRRAWAESLRLAGIPYVKPYVLRHCTATWALDQDVPLKTVSLMLGHAQVSTTVNRYYGAVAELRQKREAAARLPKLVVAQTVSQPQEPDAK